jgi:sugar lactone lactonase YvrE
MAFLFCIGLAACGGGGSGDSMTSNSPSGTAAGLLADRAQAGSEGRHTAGNSNGNGHDKDRERDKDQERDKDKDQKPNKRDTGLFLLAGNMGGPGSLDAIGAAARFSGPSGIAVDTAGNLYVADTGNNTIRKITAGGRVVSTLAGSAGVTGSADGNGAAAQFNAPHDLAVDAAGNVYVADRGNNTIRKITAAGVVTTLAGTAGVTGSADGVGPAAQFNGLRGIAVDAAGNLYVGDLGNFTIRKITAAGVVTTFAGTPGVFGSPFLGPLAIAADTAGNLYVADTGNTTNTSIKKITPGGVVTLLFGGTGRVQGIAVDTAGNVYVSDQLFQAITKITPAGVFSILAGSGVAGSADGSGTVAQFNQPSGIAVDAAGTLYVADAGNSTIRQVTPTGVVSTLAGSAGVTGSADGSGAAAQFNQPSGIAADSAGNLYVADAFNNAIRKITVAGEVSTLAGSAGVAGRGSADGSGSAARFFNPAGIATDTAGNLYVADTGNQTIRKITAAGVVSTLAGSVGVCGSANGSGTAAQFCSPAGIATDTAGNLYVADTGNQTIRKITAAGEVSTLAGGVGVTGSADGNGSAAQFNRPVGIAVDTAGNLHVTDTGNATIRQITPAGVVSTLAGSAGVAGSADGIGSAAGFFNPAGIAVDTLGNLYVADSSNSTLRKITAAGVVTTVAGVARQNGIVLGRLPGSLSLPQGVAVIDSHTLALISANSVLKLVLP